MFWIQIPLRIIPKPIKALISSSPSQHRKSQTIGSVVNLESTKATGATTTQEKTESNKKVTKVFPPERRVK